MRSLKASLDMYSLGKGLSKTIQAGASWLGDYVEHIIN